MDTAPKTSYEDRPRALRQNTMMGLERHLLRLDISNENLLDRGADAQIPSERN
jgi:hypothetical protein